MANEMRDKLIKSIETARNDWWEKAGHNQTSKASADYIADCLLDDGWVRPPCKVGDPIWIVETEGGEAVDITCYIFLAKSKGCIIATSWINDYDIDETIEYHINETQENLDTDLAVFSDEYCFATKEEAEQKFKEMGGGNGKGE